MNKTEQLVAISRRLKAADLDVEDTDIVWDGCEWTIDGMSASEWIEAMTSD